MLHFLEIADYFSQSWSFAVRRFPAAGATGFPGKFQLPFSIASLFFPKHNCLPPFPTLSNKKGGSSNRLHSLQKFPSNLIHYAKVPFSGTVSISASILS